jgi:phage I-like protein
MTKQSHTPNNETAIHIFGAALTVNEAGAPDWITLFPKTGKITTRDERELNVDAQALMDVFKAQNVFIPIDINHATETAATSGGRSDAVGWITEMELRDNALMGRVEWLPKGRKLVTDKKYRYTSPAVFADKITGKTTWIKSVALVTAPALDNQPVLNTAQNSSLEPSNSEPLKDAPMKSILHALGLNADADEAKCLSAVDALKLTASTAIPKVIHDKVVEQLSAASTELETLKAASHKAKIDALLEGALKAKIIVPAERPEFEALCANEAGFAQVQTLFAKKTPMLETSKLETAKAEIDSGELSPHQLAAKARELQKLASERGETLSIADAVGQLIQD